ncbi:type 1 fimbrial protein [Pseudomonas chlororaphis]|uniref:type 1 fimbrial protein n=1 Tax=Pseudomonas chlororaphis TaxID=587753 RepID=UPI00209AE3B1|nr:type 1 fimbrial protein [Pseudomonas chlororaphis]MCO7568818.1 type 1 fimbrial protein [Pseudomonas chlororaphis]MCO7590931.1 type 1 fimbrial protein [Pseudomonas chlororaphis]
MNATFASTAFGLLLGLSSSCFAAAPVAQGVIRFTGSIVESHCTTSAASTGLSLRQCPQGARGGAIDVTRVGTSVSAVDRSAVKLKLLADSGSQGRYYDQQYAFVDQSGKAVTSGTYLITLSVP